MTLLRATSLQAPGRMSASLAELQELMDALMAGDGKAARDAATRHVQHAAAAAIELLRGRAGTGRRIGLCRGGPRAPGG